MKVNDGTLGPIRSERPRDARPTPATAGSTSRQPTPEGSERVDRVEISAAGRAKVTRLDPVDPGVANRLAAIRQRVLAGAYETDVVVANVAQRILDRGDV